MLEALRSGLDGDAEGACSLFPLFPLSHMEDHMGIPTVYSMEIWGNRGNRNSPGSEPVSRPHGASAAPMGEGDQGSACRNGGGVVRIDVTEADILNAHRGMGYGVIGQALRHHWTDPIVTSAGWHYSADEAFVDLVTKNGPLPLPPAARNAERVSMRILERLPIGDRRRLDALQPFSFEVAAPFH